ncbi:hypothetical protein PV325_007833 [Microctonus aethiopoides]|nr:hypothetical protein PV325_007833 [Microctonus aethiopoides]
MASDSKAIKLRSNSRSVSPGLTDDTLTSPVLTPSSSMEATLNSFIQQQTKFNEQQSKFNNNMSELLSQQSQNIKDQNSKLNEIHSIAKTVNDNQERINKLEQQNQFLTNKLTQLIGQNKILSNDIQGLKTSVTHANKSSSSEIIFSNVPVQLSNNLHSVVEKVLSALEAPQLVSDILQMRKINNKTLSSASSSDKRPNNISFIVRFKSENVARHLINLKRRKGLLSIKQLLDVDVQGSIFVNEFLNSTTHVLYRKAKEICKKNHWKYVWVSDGMIFARRDDNTDKINVVVENDLQLLTASI